jgi:hypothetical protein
MTKQEEVMDTAAKMCVVINKLNTIATPVEIHDTQKRTYNTMWMVSLEVTCSYHMDQVKSQVLSTPLSQKQPNL